MISKSGESIEIHHNMPVYVSHFGKWYQGTLAFHSEHQTWKQIADGYITAMVTWQLKNGSIMQKRMRVYEKFQDAVQCQHRAASLERPNVLHRKCY